MENAPNFDKNILSIGSRGPYIKKIFSPRNEIIFIDNKTDKEIGKAVLSPSNIYLLENDPDNHMYTTEDLFLKHTQLGHKKLETLEKTLKDTDFDFSGYTNDDITCEACLVTKATMNPAPNKARNRATELLQRIHMDTIVDVTPISMEGYRYGLVICDEWSRYTWTFPMARKSDVFPIVRDWMALVENQTQKKIKTMRTDNGTEFCNKEM
jgi:hypothetical protein